MYLNKYKINLIQHSLQVTSLGSTCSFLKYLNLILAENKLYFDPVSEEREHIKNINIIKSFLLKIM